MVFGFVIWSIVFLVLLGVGIRAWKSDKAVGFFTGTKPPEVTDVRKYNRSVAVLWFAYAGLFEFLGLPLLFLKQNRSEEHTSEAERIGLFVVRCGRSGNDDCADDYL